MEKLIIPQGCTFEGEITAIAHEGDIQITSTMVPARIHSDKGMIHYVSGAKTTACEEITAPQGMVELKADILVVEKIIAAEAQISANECEIAELSLTGHVALDVHDIVLTNLHAGSATLSGDTIKADIIEVEGDLHLEANLTMIREIHAGRVIIHGSIDCKQLEARDGVTVVSGNVAIKRLDAPEFSASAEVTGIVVLATCKTVKAQGVRGFLHPNELGMLADAAATPIIAPARARFGVESEPASHPQSTAALAAVAPAPGNAFELDDDIETPVAASADEANLVMDSGFEAEGDFDEDAPIADDFEAAQAFAAAEAEFEAAPGITAFDEASTNPYPPGPEARDDEAVVTLEDEFEDYDTVLVADDLPDGAGTVAQDQPQSPEDAPSAFFADDEFDEETEHLDPPTDDFIDAPEPISPAHDFAAEEADAEADDPFEGDDFEHIDTGELMDHFDDISEPEPAGELEPFSVEDIAPPLEEAEPHEALTQFSSEPQFDAFNETYDTRDQANDLLPPRRGNSGEFDTVQLDPEALKNLSSSFEAMPMIEDELAPDFEVPDELESADSLSIPEISDIHAQSEGSADDTPAAHEPPDSPIPEFFPGDLTDKDFEVVSEDYEELESMDLPDEDDIMDVPEELSADDFDELSGTFDPDELEAIADQDFESGMDELDDELAAENEEPEVEDPFGEAPHHSPASADDGYDLDGVALPEIDDYEPLPDDDNFEEDPLGEAVQDVYDELSDIMGSTPTSSEFLLPPPTPEEKLFQSLFAILEQVRSYFEEEYQPINQIQRYLEEHRLNLFYKESNRNAVLGSFDKHNNAQVSQLVRNFFATLDQYREQNP